MMSVLMLSWSLNQNQDSATDEGDDVTARVVVVVSVDTEGNFN